MNKLTILLWLVPALNAVPAMGQQDGVPALDHVFILLLENHNYGEIIGSANAPYLTQLSRQYNSAANYSAVQHPSLPNYLVLIAGDYFGVANDESPKIAVPPGPWSFDAPTIGSQLEGIGKDWRDYQEDLPDVGSVRAGWPGDTQTGEVYAAKHNPFPYFHVHQTRAELRKMVPLTRLFSDMAGPHMPALSFIVPNQCNNMHNMEEPLSPCFGYGEAEIVSRGDREVETLVTAIMGSRAWQGGRNAIFITFDEGKGVPLGDRVPALVITNYGRRGVQDSTYYTHYSLLKTIEAAFGLPYLGHAADASTKTMAPMLAPRNNQRSGTKDPMRSR